ncbi:MAG TPA: hypothetical protein EYP21_08995 [Syntrophaceae bacterium]|nr:hypothetical protein [Syntrophaceae bacterium]
MEDLIEKLKLTNGLIVEFWDRSGRDKWGLWTVRLFVKSTVSIKEEYFSDLTDSQRQYQRALNTFGTEIIYTHEKTRAHVPEEDRITVFNRITQRFKDTVINYLSKEDFPKKFILKEVFSRA